MQTYSWDAAAGVVSLGSVEAKPIAHLVEYIRRKGCPAPRLANFIVMATADHGFSDVEARWYAAHAAGDTATRDALEAEFGWLATYRGEPGDDVPTMPVDKVRMVLRAALNAARDYHASQPVSVDLPDLGETHSFDCDQTAQMRITAAVLLGQPQDWVTADNDTVSLTATDLQAVGAAMGARVAQAVLVARQHKDAVLAAADPLAVDITTGWPS